VVADVPVVLASGSPRRRELLDQLGIVFSVRAADIDESVLDGEDPVTYVARLSREKAAAVPVDTGHARDRGRHHRRRRRHHPRQAGRRRGGPGDADAAMSGRRHHVHTGVTLRLDERSATEVTTTAVDVVAIDEATAAWYVATGEPFDKAGGYAIQGAGGVLVAAVTGSVSNVVGLPLATVRSLAARLGVDLLGG
jgi:septum formation protein